MNSIVFRSVMILLAFGMVALGSSLSVMSAAQRRLGSVPKDSLQKVAYHPHDSGNVRTWGDCALDATKPAEVRALCTREIRRHFDQVDSAEKTRFSRIPSDIIRLSRELQ